MAELKQGRWVKVHEPGQANFVENDLHGPQLQEGGLLAGRVSQSC